MYETSSVITVLVWKLKIEMRGKQPKRKFFLMERKRQFKKYMNASCFYEDEGNTSFDFKEALS